MKKVLLLIFSIALFASACKEKTPDNTGTSFPTDGLTPDPKQRALVLEATGAWCQFCPRGAELMLRINGTYKDDVVALALHGGNGTDPIKNPTSEFLLAKFLPGTGFPGFYVQEEDVPENEVMNAINVALATQPIMAVIHVAEETDTSWDVYAKVAIYKTALNEDFMIQSYLVLDEIDARDFGGGFNLNQVSTIPYVQTGSGSVPTRWTEDKGIVNGVATVKSGETFKHLESIIMQSTKLPMGLPLAEVNPFGKEYIEGDILGTKNTPIIIRIKKDPSLVIPAGIDVSMSVATIIWRLRQDGSGEYDYVNSYLSHVKAK